MTNSFLNDEALGEVVGGVTRTVENDSVGYANIREEPGLNSKVFFKINNGEKVYLTGNKKKKDGVIRPFLPFDICLYFLRNLTGFVQKNFKFICYDKGVKGK